MHAAHVFPKKEMSMTRKYSNPTLQTIILHREEKSQKTISHKTPGEQLK